jgi:hypothetical protein
MVFMKLSRGHVQKALLSAAVFTALTLLALRFVVYAEGWLLVGIMSGVAFFLFMLFAVRTAK